MEQLRNIHPGEMLLEEFLKPLGISQSQLARRLGVSIGCINKIALGKRPITAEIALRLARFFGTDARSWMNLQVDYDLEETFRELGDRLDREVRPREV